MPARIAADPDLFQPFSAIPWHNNKEAHYRYANTKLFGYLRSHDQQNIENYGFKGYHDSYDHGDKKVHWYNWTSAYPSQSP